jgi:hypothetical protein
MQSFGYVEVGNALYHKNDKVPFMVLMLMGDRLFVQRTLRLRDLAAWLRPQPGGGFEGIGYGDVKIREKLTCTEFPGSDFVVLDKDRGEIIVVEGFIAIYPMHWELSAPQ